MIVEIGQTIDFGFFILEMDEGWESSGVNLKSVDVFWQFILLLFEIGKVFLISSPQNDL